MLCMFAPGGVVAGVLGIERALLRPVSMEIGLPPWFPPMPCCCVHWKPSDGPMFPITLDALVGGVGNVCARSSVGRAMVCEGRGGWGPGKVIA